MGKGILVPFAHLVFYHREIGIHVHERGESIDTVPTLADGFGFAFFLGCQPVASDPRSIARFAGTEVREPSRFERRMESL